MKMGLTLFRVSTGSLAVSDMVTYMYSIHTVSLPYRAMTETAWPDFNST
jgi:hypothetical protein